MSRFLYLPNQGQPSRPQTLSRHDWLPNGSFGYHCRQTAVGAGTETCSVEHMAQYIDVHFSSMYAFSLFNPVIVFSPRSKCATSFSVLVTGDPLMTDPAHDPLLKPPSPIP